MKKIIRDGGSQIFQRLFYCISSKNRVYEKEDSL